MKEKAPKNNGSFGLLCEFIQETLENPIIFPSSIPFIHCAPKFNQISLSFQQHTAAEGHCCPVNNLEPPKLLHSYLQIQHSKYGLLLLLFQEINMSSLVLACPLGKFSKLKISQWPIFTLTFGVTSSCPTLQKTR